MVSPSIFGEKILVVKCNSFYEKTALNMKCLSEKNDSCFSCGLTTCDVKCLYFLLVQIFSNILNEDFGRFQLEATRAYKCKWILGLCHLPPRLEN